MLSNGARMSPAFAPPTSIGMSEPPASADGGILTEHRGTPLVFGSFSASASQNPPIALLPVSHSLARLF
jgi:hypothetical protein